MWDWKLNIHDMTRWQLLTLAAYWGAAMGLCGAFAFWICCVASDKYERFKREQWIRMQRLDGPYK